MDKMNKIKGMLFGAFLGDALGAPHEFFSIKYTGNLEHPIIIKTQFQGQKRFPIGSFTDDSQMTLQLLRSIIKNKGYDRDTTIMNYLEWASTAKMMGRNTRALFGNLKTLSGYEKRSKKIMVGEISQSNGALMRCSPLAIIDDEEAIKTDCYLSNPCPIVLDCNRVYITLLKRALNGKKIKNIVKLAETEEVKAVIKQALAKEDRDIVNKKGWCLHALYCAIYCMDMEYDEAMEWIITQHRTDTDTNACITGALIGAIHGFTILEETQKDNIDVLLKQNNELGDIHQLLEKIRIKF